jgi:acylphosphatase
MPVRKHVIYRGRVQGVGFRYTAQTIAKEVGVAGYVRNLPDRTVELVVEGTPEKVEAVLQRLAFQMAANITEAVITEQPAEGLPSFAIRF